MLAEELFLIHLIHIEGNPFKILDPVTRKLSDQIQESSCFSLDWVISN